MPTNNPWAGLAPSSTAMLGRRVDPGHAQAWWWCIEPTGRFGLALYSVTGRELPTDLSELKGLTVSIRKQKSDGTHFLLLLLESGADWELFHALCVDLVESTEKSTSPDNAVDVAITRLRRWQRFLSRGKKPGLTDEEVRGMLAELLFLRDELNTKVGIAAAIRGWAGPHGHPQDFAVGDRAFEVKSHMASARQAVEISSLDQLESTARAFLLVVQDLSPAQAGVAGSITLAQLVKEIRDLAKGVGQDIVDRFDDAVDAQGYEDGRRYADVSYLDSGRRFFRVAKDFPRIIRSGTQNEILRARYALDISQCGRFQVAGPWV